MRFKYKRIISICMVMIIFNIINPIFISVQAVENNESIVLDNNEDVNSDGKIDILDLSCVSAAYNYKKGDSKYNVKYDIDSNGIIDVFDIVMVSNKLSNTATTYSVFQDREDESNILIGIYPSAKEANAIAVQYRNAYVIYSNGKELWRGRYEWYEDNVFKGRYGTLDEAIKATGYRDKSVVRDLSNQYNIVWECNITIGIVSSYDGSLIVRKGPGSSYERIGLLLNNEKVEIINDKNEGWYEIKYNGSTGFVDKRYIKFKEDLKTIVIDPGHGGSDPGAIGNNGLLEKDVVLNVSLKVRNILEANGYNVVMTRTTDKYVSLAERARISNESGGSAFVSVHTNSFTNTGANGTETLVYEKRGVDNVLANNIQNNLINSLRLTNRGVKERPDLYVLKHNQIPATLVEIAFISNYNEERLLGTDSFQTKSAEAIANGIMSTVK